MRTLVFDGRTGAAGDMICAALIAAGGDPAVLSPVEDRLPVRYEIGETVDRGIGATTVDVVLTETGAGDGHDERDHAHGDHADDEHDHAHDDHADDERDHAHNDHTHNERNHDDHAHAEGAGIHRTYPEVVALVESMDLPATAESTALDAFELLGRAEASVHGTDLADTAFHEVGADDAIADVVGAALLLADLDVDRVVTTPVAVGGGEVEMSHGVYPIPAPAVVAIAERTGLTLVGGPVDRELLTPTGAAVLGAVADTVDALPELRVASAGYGAGETTLESHPNVLRALVGDGGGSPDRSGPESSPDRLRHDDIAVLETNLDDAAPEVLGGLQETLADAGARDVTVVPTTMKKSRPGHLVKVICKPADAAAVAERLARETGTLGVRQAGATHRWIADRSFETATLSVDGVDHEVSVKVAATAAGDVYDVSAEYDDAAAVAAATGLPIRAVLRRAEATVHDRGSDENSADES